MNTSFLFQETQPTVNVQAPAIRSIGAKGYLYTVPASDEDDLLKNFENFQSKQTSEQDFFASNKTAVYFLGRYDGKVLDLTVAMPYEDCEPLGIERIIITDKSRAKNDQDLIITRNLICMIFVVSIIVFSVDKISGYNFVNPLISLVISMLSFFLLVVIYVKEKEDNLRQAPSSSRALAI